MPEEEEEEEDEEEEEGGGRGGAAGVGVAAAAGTTTDLELLVVVADERGGDSRISRTNESLPVFSELRCLDRGGGAESLNSSSSSSDHRTRLLPREALELKEDPVDVEGSPPL